ncbi:polysaccharide biosynthesis family protein [Vibrio paracholerae HE-16]|uniref:flippase n=1 Tax=Vibrio TaxID=662 RepID=UPI00028DC0E2|nr:MULTISPECIES: flippase [Vibrio]EKG91177.1 polysaccharide biosynthesis family protein [Vibrio paracholerae HE-16]TXY67876.1 flippase [Vibrio cholerae]TXZ61907.1 flippase [Vibrio cholerae]BCN16808.1 putative O-antigen flippase [Vibrio cholerae]BCN20714.1 putative O-antigen flippase [Vibrio cholerae]
MLKKIKHKLTDTEEKRRLASNILSLGVLQGANYILPLLTVPYLVRVLGPEYFGKLAFATATITYFMLVTDYGFNLSATRQISIHRYNKDKVNEIFSSVMMIKTALMVVSFGLMSLLVFSFEKFSQNWEVYYITFGMVIGQVLFPVWFFQGMERMKYITYLNLGAKAFFTVCIFIFVKEKADYLLVPLLTAMGFIVAGIWSLYLVKKEFNVRFTWQTVATLKHQLVEGWHVFFSSIAISVYTISTTFVLGLFTNNTVVGYFAAADKIVQATKGLYQPVSQAIYPLIGKKIHEDKQAGLTFVHKITWVVGTGMFLISVLLFLLAEPIINLMLGQQYQQSILLLQIMAFLPFIIALSNIFGIQTMLNLGYKQAFSRILVVAAILGVGLSLVLVPIYEGLGIAVTLLAVECFVTVIMYFYLKIRLRIY